MLNFLYFQDLVIISSVTIFLAFIISLFAPYFSNNGSFFWRNTSLIVWVFGFGIFFFLDILARNDYFIDLTREVKFAWSMICFVTFFSLVYLGERLGKLLSRRRRS